MNNAKKIILVLVMSGISGSSGPVWAEKTLEAGAPSASASFTLVASGRPAAVIAVGEQASMAEKQAAKELQKYLLAVSGAELSIIPEPQVNLSPAEVVLVIGTPETSTLVAAQQELLRLGAVKYDGFVVQALALPDRACVVFAAREPRGCIYAVYEYLEKKLGVGFFWNTERIPHQSTITASGDLSIRNSPRFAHREYCPGWGRWEKFWTYSQWHDEIDWMLKHKFNVFYPGMLELLPRTTLQKLVYSKMGVAMPELDAVDRYKLEVSQKVIGYARDLGMRYTFYSFSGWVPETFKEVYPQAHYFGIDFAGLTRRIYLYPTDPLFQTVGQAFIEEYNELFGAKGHLYNIDMYAELKPDLSAEERTQIKTDFARAVCTYVKTADPEGLWSFFAWTWVYQFERFWSPGEIKDFLAVIPDEDLLVIDPRANNEPTYDFLDHYWGKKWGFGVLHSMLGWSHLHGQLRDLISDYQAAMNDEKCVASYLTSEISDNNPLFYSLAADLAWNPQAVELDAYLKHYARLRYGAERALPMERALHLLADSVYNADSEKTERLGPMYWKLADIMAGHCGPLDPWRQRFCYLAPLRDTLRIMLGVSSKTMEDDRLYLSDLLDVSRQYIAELFNYHFIQMEGCFASGDPAGFEKAAATVQRLLTYQKQLLSCWQPCWMKTEIENATREFPDGTEAARQIKGAYAIMFSFQANEWGKQLTDYSGKDYYELMRDYYEPRMEIYISHLRNCLSKGAPKDKEYLRSKFYTLAVNFRDNPLRQEGYRRAGEIVGLVEKAWAEFGDQN